MRLGLASARFRRCRAFRFGPTRRLGGFQPRGRLTALFRLSIGLEPTRFRHVSLGSSACCSSRTRHFLLMAALGGGTVGIGASLRLCIRHCRLLASSLGLPRLVRQTIGFARLRVT
ncbi:hypothetical protein WJ47_02470 [Burkholderia ubonensis]|uniref:HTH araC/xylS-type domain-containing protein n=1 Tax=Burkholderia ubonensis TaxID=101571 RepID=A0AB73G7F4_9BURK|nr:hypothetical protein WJ44_25795 [Burkholderia ubonensis]KVL73347.1 hypothetical protein WJ47_02470 [Burkholderia ubonensis]KVM35610.1 hypothetical protein WJ54_04470 [Burkholderia ubonensis]KVM39023.1 hypothetical protein WJ53_26310 [Burkholderia ubonensis]